MPIENETISSQRTISFTVEISIGFIVKFPFQEWNDLNFKMRPNQWISHRFQAWNLLWFQKTTQLHTLENLYAAFQQVMSISINAFVQFSYGKKFKRFHAY